MALAKTPEVILTSESSLHTLLSSHSIEAVPVRKRSQTFHGKFYHLMDDLHLSSRKSTKKRVYLSIHVLFVAGSGNTSQHSNENLHEQAKATFFSGEQVSIRFTKLASSAKIRAMIHPPRSTAM